MLETRERSNTLGSEDDAINQVSEEQALAALQKAHANIQVLKKFIAENSANSEKDSEHTEHPTTHTITEKLPTTVLQENSDAIPPLEEDVTYENKQHPKKDTAPKPQQRSMLDIKLQMLRNKQPQPKKKEDEVIDPRVAQAIQSHIARFGVQRTFLSSVFEIWNQIDALFECIRSGDNSLIEFQQSFTEALAERRTTAQHEGASK